MRAKSRLTDETFGEPSLPAVDIAATMIIKVDNNLACDQGGRNGVVFGQVG